MKVLHVTTRLNVGGVAALVLNLAAGLPAEGVEVVLATGQVADGEVEVPDLPTGVVRVDGLGRSPQPADDLRALRTMRQLVRDVKPDIVHTHAAKAGFISRLASEGLRVPRVHTFHGHLLTGYFSPRITRAVTLAERLLATRTDLLISSGARVGAELRAAGVGRGQHWLNVPPGVTPPAPSGVTQDRTVAFVGRLVEVKRLDRLIAVARLLPDVEFLVAGDGPLGPSLRAEAPPNVQWLGWTQDVGTVYGRAAAVLLCSDNEAMPLALIEAALCGVPGVTTDVGSSSEVVQHGVTGFVSDPDPAALASALRDLLADEGRRQAMGFAAKADAEKRFTVKAMCSAHADAYRSLLAGSG